MIKIEQHIVDKASKLNEVFHHFKSDFFRFWAEDIVFTCHWWLVVILTVLPWVVWAFVRIKESTERLLCAGFAAFVYEPMHWRHVYSFPIFIFLYIIGHYFAREKNTSRLSREHS